MADAEMQENTQQQQQQPQQPQKETFSREYVQELREEAKSYRLKLKEVEDKHKAAEAAVEQVRKEADEGLTKAQQAANERVIRAELKTVAVEAGMIDMDGLKLADLSKVTLDDKGEVVGAKELMAELKESKPYLFKAAGSSSTQPGTPKPEASASKSVKDLSPADYAAQKAKFLKGLK